MKVVVVVVMVWRSVTNSDRIFIVKQVVWPRAS
jgi:hypothetical protein